MKVIKIKFEYGCFPVWIYGENNEWIENDLPPYLIGDSDIDPKFLNIQKIYDSLYLDDGKEFKYIGFKEAEKRENFFRELLLIFSSFSLFFRRLITKSNSPKKFSLFSASLNPIYLNSFPSSKYKL